MIETLGIMLVATHLGAMNPGAERTLPTPGLYVITACGATLGAYRNTLRRTSWQVGYTQADGGWAVSAGLVSGYPDTSEWYRTDPPGRPKPFVALSYRWGASHGARLITAPQKTIPLALALEVTP